MTLTAQPLDETKDRIRVAARQVICELGIDNVTTREIARAAGVNIAAINYHFGGKDKLAVEVFREVVRRSAEYRLARLEEILEKARISGARPDLEEIVASFVDGYFRGDAPAEGELLANLILKNRISPTPWTSQLIYEEIDGMATRYMSALEAALPRLSPAEVNWRYHFMVGTVVTAANHRDPEHRLERLSDNRVSTTKRDDMRRNLVDFIARGFGSVSEG